MAQLQMLYSEWLDQELVGRIQIKSPPTIFSLWLFGFGGNLTQLFFVQYSLHHIEANKYNRIIETRRSTKARASFVGDAPRVWNKAPSQVTNAKSLQIAKKEVRKFCKTLPI